MLPPVLAHMKQLGHKVFDNPKYDYDLNIYGIRNKAGASNTFDDTLGVLYLWDGCWRGHHWDGTVDPGAYYLEHPMNVKGTAVMACGQYRGAYEVGTHRGKRALIQSGPVSVFRDYNRDKSVDRQGKPESGLFGCNLHRAGKASKFVNRWSAGCQVWSREKDFEEFLEICYKQVKLTGFKTFTYTLMDQWW